jgi:hypothetical protein
MAVAGQLYSLLKPYTCNTKLNRKVYNYNYNKYNKVTKERKFTVTDWKQKGDLK